MGDSPASILHNTSGTEIATASNPVRVDPTGTTTQPVSATALPLPTGASTSAKQPALGTAGTPSADVISVQGVSGGTPQPVSDGGSSITVDGTVTANQGTAIALSGAWPEKITDGTNVAAVKAASTAAVAADPALVVAISPNNTPVLPSGAATSALQTTGNTSVGNIDTKTPTLGQKAMAGSTPVVLASDQSAVPVADGGGSLTIDATALPLPTGASTETTLSAVSTKLPATLGQKAMAASLAVVVASDQSVLPVRNAPATAATVASVTAAVADTTLLAANASRMGAAVFNASTAILYLKLGTGASLTSYTVRLTSNAYYEIPFGYSGQINGYWAAANGAALVTQVTQ